MCYHNEGLRNTEETREKSHVEKRASSCSLAFQGCHFRHPIWGQNARNTALEDPKAVSAMKGTSKETKGIRLVVELRQDLASASWASDWTRSLHWTSFRLTISLWTDSWASTRSNRGIGWLSLQAKVEPWDRTAKSPRQNGSVGLDGQGTSQGLDVGRSDGGLDHLGCCH